MTDSEKVLNWDRLAVLLQTHNFKNVLDIGAGKWMVVEDFQFDKKYSYV